MADVNPLGFDPDAPPPFDLTSLDWALWTFIERTEAKNLTRAQITERLRLHMRVVDGVTYYRPLAAAAEYITRPGQLIERNRNDMTDKYIDPFKVAKEWRDLQATFDAQIPAPVSGEESSGGGVFTGDLTFTGWG